MGADFAAPAGKKALGRPRVVPLRGVIDALLYFCGRRPWRLLPRDFPKRSTVQSNFYAGRPKGYGKGQFSCWSNRLGSAVAAKPAHPADIQDRDGAGFDPLPLPMAAPSLRPSRAQAFADGAYARATSWRQCLPGAGSGRWSSDPTRPKVFKYRPGDGSSSGPSPGLDAIAG